MTFGWRNSKLDQISRIDRGLIELGYQIDSLNPQFSYSNNPTYEDALVLSSFDPNIKKIFNVLDVATHIKNYPFDLLKSQLLQADAITSISVDTQTKLKNFLGLDSIVIYNPLKISYRKPEIKKDVFAVFCGRLNDPNKRFNLVIETLQKLGKTSDDLWICGPEQPSWGIYKGIVTDDELNDIYNRAKYYICPTKENGGIQLPPLEATFCGVLPIECSDNSTAHEFLDPLFIADPFADSLAAKIKTFEKNRVEISQKLIDEAPIKYKRLNYKEIAKSIISVYNGLL